MKPKAADARQIERNLFGWLESPQEPVEPGAWMLVSGWAFATQSPIVEVFAQTGASRQRLQYGLAREDVRLAYPDHPSALHSGFFAYVKVERSALAPVSVEVRCIREDGTELPLFSRVVTRHPLAVLILELVHRVSRVFRGSTRHARVVETSSSRAGFAAAARAELQEFLASAERVRFERRESPLASIVVVLWNRAELTLRCLRSICEQHGQLYEVILVDNCSTDDTQRLLARVDGATIVRNAANLGFGPAANIGSRAARGVNLLFLNSDAVLQADAIAALVDVASSDASVGAVGGKLIFPDGRLQEAGSIIWQDGACEAYGRDGDPQSSAFNFEREVDFCSAALMMTPRSTFEAEGGFDERFRPAYYEDADYCVRLWKGGHKVLYQPAASAVHLEFGSSTSRQAALRMQEERRGIFWAKHADWLREQPQRGTPLHVARTRQRGRRSILVIDDAWPDPALGSGFPRAAALLRALVRLEYLVAFYPMNGAAPAMVPRDELAEVELIEQSGLEHLGSFLGSHRRFDTIVVSRPHNLQYVKGAIGDDLSGAAAPVVYDAEAVYALREAARRRLAGAPVSRDEEQSLIGREIGLVRGCAAVLTVNELELTRFRDGGARNVAVLGHALRPTPTGPDFAARKGLLFVGALGADSPNEDAVLFLVRHVLPAMARSAPQRLPLTIIGAHISDRVRALAGTDITVLSDVADLTPFYAAARVFVAPTRYSAGIPLKLLEAAAHGVPIVCTPQLARQLGWDSGRDLIAGESPDEIARAIERVCVERGVWQRLREAALIRVAEECAPEDFRAQIQSVLEPLGGNPKAAMNRHRPTGN